MREQLITALHAAASRLESGGYYKWVETENCNCGILAQELLGISADDLRKAINESRKEFSYSCHSGNPTWQFLRREEKCSLTGTPIAEIVAALRWHGLTEHDIYELENCSNCEVLARMNTGQDYSNYNEPKFVAQYMRAWATMLAKEKEDVMFTIWIKPPRLLHALSKYGGLAIVAEPGVIGRFTEHRYYGGSRTYTFNHNMPCLNQ
jgi:hypothetical protein